MVFDPDDIVGVVEREKGENGKRRERGRREQVRESVREPERERKRERGGGRTETEKRDTDR